MRSLERSGAPPGGATFEPAQIGPLKGEWVRLPNSSPNRLILYFHGGGYIAGSPANPSRARRASGAGQRCDRLLRSTIAWRRSSRFPPPCAMASIVIVCSPPKAYSPSSIVLAGDGSGGGLAFSVLIAARNAQASDAGRLRCDVALGRPVACRAGLCCRTPQRMRR